MFSKKVWKRFVQEGVLDHSRLSRRVAESWYRSRQAGVNPYGGEGRHILTGERLSDRIAQNRTFLEVATPFVQRLYRYIKGSGAIILLIDPDGFVLTLMGDAPVIQRAQAINFVKGVKWTEEEVGTNAIGTALKTNEPIVLTGAEHYAVASQDWMCAASPIRDEQGNLLGLLDVSSPVEQRHTHTLAAVVATAYAIEQEWRSQQERITLELLRLAPSYLQDDHPEVICNTNQEIIIGNQALGESFWPQKHRLEELLQEGYGVKEQQAIIDKQGTPLGYKVTLLPKRPPSSSTIRRTTSAKSASRSLTKSASHPTSSMPKFTLQFKGEIGRSAAFQDLLQRISRVARHNTDVYIWGETGTGKELIAQTIHANSDRSEGPFIAINCGAIPAELLESELFGYAPGAFTGAQKGGYKGKFEQAQQGTLFLDEVSELPLQMQAALLRVLEERKVTPLGSTRSIPLDIRIISASNRNIKQMVAEGQFRADLFYRLHRFPLYVPALRERKEDIPSLIRYYCQVNNWYVHFPPDVLQALVDYPWPGNVRELFNVLEQMRITANGEALTINDLPADILSHSALMASNSSADMRRAIGARQSELLSSAKAHHSNLSRQQGNHSIREQIQKENLIEALRQTNGNISEAAKVLKVSRSTVYRLLKKYAL